MQECGRASEIARIDPKCWVCGIFVKPVKVAYQPLRCVACLGKKKVFVFVRPTQAEMEALFK